MNDRQVTTEEAANFLQGVLAALGSFAGQEEKERPVPETRRMIRFSVLSFMMELVDRERKEHPKEALPDLYGRMATKLIGIIDPPLYYTFAHSLGLKPREIEEALRTAKIPLMDRICAYRLGEPALKAQDILGLIHDENWPLNAMRDCGISWSEIATTCHTEHSSPAELMNALRQEGWNEDGIVNFMARNVPNNQNAFILCARHRPVEVGLDKVVKLFVQYKAAEPKRLLSWMLAAREWNPYQIATALAKSGIGAGEISDILDVLHNEGLSANDAAASIIIGAGITDPEIVLSALQSARYTSATRLFEALTTGGFGEAFDKDKVIDLLIRRTTKDETTFLACARFDLTKTVSSCWAHTPAETMLEWLKKDTAHWGMPQIARALYFKAPSSVDRAKVLRLLRADNTPLNLVAKMLIDDGQDLHNILYQLTLAGFGHDDLGREHKEVFLQKGFRLLLGNGKMIPKRRVSALLAKIGPEYPPQKPESSTPAGEK